MEIKGVHTYINVNIENAEADTSYTLTLICDDLIDLGKIYSDTHGRSKSELILKTDDFLSGELEQSAILIHRDDQVLLGEYLDKEDGKIEEYIESLEFQEPETEEELEVGEEEVQSEAEVQPEVGEYQLQEEFIEDLNPYPEEEPIKRQTSDYVLSILRYFPYAEPFKEELPGHNWWRIEYNGEVEEDFLPYFDLFKDTNAHTLMNKYGHYLFGLYNDKDNVKYYIFALPGKFTLEEHPNDGKPGFETWFDGIDEVGYWLIYIDPITGEVIGDLDPMNPS